MFIMGLDLSLSSTGVSIINCDGKIWATHRITTEKKNYINEDVRLNSIADSISFILKSYEGKIKRVAIENQYISRNSPSIMSLRKLLGVVARMIYKEHNIDIEYYAPTTIKKEIAGNGKASKEDVANAIYETYKYSLLKKYSDRQGKDKTSDIYDAIAVALTALSLSKKFEQ